MWDTELNQTIFRALGLGVGVHHAGILPSVKRLTERLFERGLCKVVFATETMSLGIHMPARSVVLQSLTKRTERGFRSLSHNELTQMAGRAGRRGIDTEGKCVIALDARDGVEDVVRVVDGSPEPIESQFKLGYGSVAMLIATGAPPEVLRRRVEASFGQYQNLKRMRAMEDEVKRLEAMANEARAFAAPCGDFERIGRYRRLRQEVEARRRASGRGRGERSAIEAGAPGHRQAPGWPQPGPHSRCPFDARTPSAGGGAPAPRRCGPAQSRRHQADPLVHPPADLAPRSWPRPPRPPPPERAAERARCS
jgi:superfamily II RNA helicase